MKTQVLILIVGGVLIVAASILADALGLGSNDAVIGWKQYSGAVLGIVLILFGAHLALHHREE